MRNPVMIDDQKLYALTVAAEFFIRDHPEDPNVKFMREAIREADKKMGIKTCE